MTKKPFPKGKQYEVPTQPFARPPTPKPEPKSKPKPQERE